MRAAGEVLEIRAAQLRFSNAETGALLNDSLALGLGPAKVALLRERTEGGGRAAARRRSGPRRPEGDRGRVWGDDQQIADYLHEFVAASPAGGASSCCVPRSWSGCAAQPATR